MLLEIREAKLTKGSIFLLLGYLSIVNLFPLLFPSKSNVETQLPLSLQSSIENYMNMINLPDVDYEVVKLSENYALCIIILY